MFARVLAAAVILVAAAGLVVMAWPQLFGAEKLPVVAQLVSMRGLAVAAALLAAVAFTLLALLVPVIRRFAASVAVLLLGFALVSIAVLATRGFGNEGFEVASPQGVTVLAWNTLGDATGPASIADLAAASGADVVALAETTRAEAVEVARLMSDAGRPMWAFTVAYDEVSKARSTSLLISVDLGEYLVDESARTTSTLPTVVARPADGTGPIIMSVHAVAPIPGEMADWREDLAWLAAACASGNVIMAGDFNSTIDHFDGLGTDGPATLGACHDAAFESDNGALGTWPTFLPALLGTPIDHVMFSSNWEVSGMRVVQTHDANGSDHRPVLAQLSPSR